MHSLLNHKFHELTLCWCDFSPTVFREKKEQQFLKFCQEMNSPCRLISTGHVHTGRSTCRTRIIPSIHLRLHWIVRCLFQFELSEMYGRKNLPSRFRKLCTQTPTASQFMIGKCFIQHISFVSMLTRMQVDVVGNGDVVFNGLFRR